MQALDKSEIKTVLIVFTVTQPKNWKPSGGRRQENECYKRLRYQQFFQVSGLCGRQFLSYWRKRFMHLCRALYGDAILVYRFEAQMAAGNQRKHVEFTFSIKALSFHSRTSMRAHEHIFYQLKWLYC